MHEIKSIKRAKQSLRQTLPHIEAYVNKLITVNAEDEVEHFKKGATVIAELSSRVERALKAEHILDISTRKKYLKEIEKAIIHGHKVLMVDVSEVLDPVLDNVLNKAVT